MNTPKHISDSTQKGYWGDETDQGRPDHRIVPGTPAFTAFKMLEAATLLDDLSRQVNELAKGGILRGGDGDSRWNGPLLMFQLNNHYLVDALHSLSRQIANVQEEAV